MYFIMFRKGVYFDNCFGWMKFALRWRSFGVIYAAIAGCKREGSEGGGDLD